MTINPHYKMLICLDVRDHELRRWDTVARFEYGIHAMMAAQALSKDDSRDWRVVDYRADAEKPTTLIYSEGKAS